MSEDGAMAESSRPRLSAVPDAPDQPVQKETSADDLLCSVARGDTASFDALYQLFVTRVFGLARRVLRDPSQAEEVAQEVFLEIWRRAGRFDPAKSSAAAWVMRLTHSRAVDRVRSVQAATDRDAKTGRASVERDVDTVVDSVEHGMERRAVQHCLERLTELQRESVTLAYYGGYTYGQVAERLSAPLPTVKTRMRDALIRLRDCLKVAL